jgi:hypothetical protein
MSLPSTRALIGLAGIMLLSGLTFFILHSSEDPQLPAKPPADEPISIADPDPLPMTDPAQTEMPQPLEIAPTKEATRQAAQLAQKIDSTLSALAIKIVDGAGAAIEGAEVFALSVPYRNAARSGPSVLWRLQNKPEEILSRARSNGDGVALLANLVCFSEFVGLIKAEGYATIEFEFETNAPGEPESLGPISLGPSAPVTVEVHDLEGKPVVGIWLRISGEPITDTYPEEYPPIYGFFGTTNDHGLVHFEGVPRVPNSNYSLSGPILRGSAEVDFATDPDRFGAFISVVVPTAQWATGRVVDTAGKPIAGGQINLWRYSRFSRKEGQTEAQLREMAPMIFGHSEMLMSDFESEIKTAADGSFRIFCPPQTQDDSLPEDEVVPDLVSAVVSLDGYLIASGKWTSPQDPLEIVVPVTHGISGRILDHAGDPLPQAKVTFHSRPAPGAEKSDEQDNPALYFEPKLGPVDSLGKFSVQVLPGTYWMEVQFPGGRHRLPGPYLVEGPVDLGDIQIPAGRTIRLTAKSADTARVVHGLEASRNTAPSEDRSERRSFFGGGSRKKTPWGARDRHWTQTNAKAEIVDSIATWVHEPDGHWRYLLEAPGFVPAIVDLEFTADSGDWEQEVEMEATGQVRIQMRQRNGEPATGITVELSPAADIPMHPMHQKLQRTARVYHNYNESNQPDADGVVRFRNVFPGEYQITSIEGDGERSFMAPPPDLDRPALAQFTVVAGQTTEIEASLASMAEIRVWVSNNGELVAGAEVAVVSKSDISIGSTRAFDPDPNGVTGPDGSLLVTSLTVGKAHTIGARIPSDNDSWYARPAWTKQEVVLEIGTQETTIQLSTGGVRLQLAGSDLSDTAEIQILEIREPAEVPADATEQELERFRLSQKFDRFEPRDWKERQRVVARIRSEVGVPAEVLHLPPGNYQVLAEFDSEQSSARVLSEAFRIDDEIFDLGTLVLVGEFPVQIQVDGIAASTEDRFSLWSLYCVRTDSQEIVESTYWSGGQEIENWMLLPGVYELILSDDETELARSSEFKVGESGVSEFSWTITEIKNAKD